MASSAQSTGTIKGEIVNIHDQGIANISLGLVEKSMKTTTNNQGNFKMKDIPPGDYIVMATGIGFNTYKKPISLKSGQTLTLDIKLSPNRHQLQQLEVVSESNINPYTLKKSNAVAKMPLKRMNNPQAYTTITQQIIQQQLVVGYTDIYKNISGTMIPLHTSNGRAGISLRGFETKSQTKDGVSSLDYFPIDPSNIERIEVIKGPSATLYGNKQSSYGGLINIITKKPYESFGGGITYTSGSFGLNRLTVDINTPLNKQKSVLFRLNSAAEYKGSFKDAGYYKDIFFSPDLSWKINQNLHFEIQGEYYNTKQPSPFQLIPYAKTKVNRVEDMGLDFSKSFNPHNIANTGKQYSLHATLHEQLSSHWKARTDFVMSTAKKGGYKVALEAISDSTLKRKVEAHPNTYKGLEIQQNFNYHINFGKFENKFLLGLDFSRYNTKKVKSTVVFDEVNFQHPGNNYYNLTQKAVSQLDFDLDYTVPEAIQNTYAAYVSDNISFDKRLSAMVSLRVDRFQNEAKYSGGKTKDKYGQTALSSKFGLIYQPIPDIISLFGNYLTGFQNVHGSDFHNKPFDPQKAAQYEFGVKVNLFSHRFTGQISYYNIDITDILRDDPEHIDYFIQDGNEISRGVEFELTTNPIPGFNIFAGYAYNQFEYRNINDNMNGRRSPDAGPAHTAHLWITYHLFKGKLKGLGFGAGGNYGSRQEEVRRFETHRFYRPEFNTLDATIFYQYSKFKISFKVNNITNEKYWTARLGIAEPRNVVGRIAFSF